MAARLRAATCLIIFLAAGLTLGACEEDVAAPSGVEEPFSMYGIINPRRSAQTMLVAPIERFLADYSGPIDATVRSTDLGTGKTLIWSDSVVTGEPGETFYIFVADFRAQFGRAYRIDVSRSDGAVSSAEARVPGRVSVTTRARTTTRGDTLGAMEVDIFGEDFHLLGADVVYTLRWQPSPGKGDVCQLPIASYPVSHIDDIAEVDGGYAFVVDLTADLFTVEGAYRADYASRTPCDLGIPENTPDDPQKPSSLRNRSYSRGTQNDLGDHDTSPGEGICRSEEFGS